MGFADRAAASGLKIAGVAAAAAILAVAAAWYWFFVAEQRQYIIGRDFRMLSNLAKQLDNALQSEATVITNLAGNERIAAEWSKRRGKPYASADITFVPAQDQSTPIGPISYQLRTEPQLALEVRNLPGSNSACVTDPRTLPDGRTGCVLTAFLRLRSGLEPMFTSKAGQGAFDALALTTPEGGVLLGAGPVAQQLRAGGLDILTSKAADGKPLTFSALAHSTAMADVSLAGVDYTLFVLPCCVPPAGGRPLVLSGLVRKEALQYSSWTIPTTFMNLAVLGLLIGVVVWPFLKLLLLGHRQQVSSYDFFHLGTTAVAGLTICTVVCLNLIAYSRLNADIDAQLGALGSELDGHATSEIRAAHDQLKCFEDGFQSLHPGSQGKVTLALQTKLTCSEHGSSRADARHVRDPDDGLKAVPPTDWPYPFFEYVFFTDEQGLQTVKLSPTDSVPSMINVQDRGYFKTLIQGQGWNAGDFCQTDKCVFELLYSWTTGEVLSVLAKQSSQRSSDGKLLPIAVIAMPMRSLIGPLLPPGFSFAVIDRAGQVLFHSDRQRNLNEDFFLETDNNRRLRAQVGAQSSESLNIRYWGAEYRAHVQPMTVPGLYIVAMARQDRALAINWEWLVVTLIFVAIYLAVWGTVALTTVWSSASWVWPDPDRGSCYLAVSALCGTLLMIAIVTGMHAGYRTLISAGLILPVGGWVGTWLILRRRPPRRDCRREPLFAYSSAAAAVLLVSGVVPGTLLFLASHQLHARSYIKNSQIAVARRLSDRFDRLRETYPGAKSELSGPRALAATMVGLTDDIDIYVKFLYGTSAGQAPPRTPGGSTANDHGLVVSFIEDFLPYYADASVEWRELLHDRAGDGSWISSYEPSDGSHEWSILTAGAGSLPLTLKSRVPSLAPAPPPVQHQAHQDEEAAEGGPIPGLVASGLLLLGLAYGVLLVFHRRIFLVGISEPLWACNQFEGHVGQNILIVGGKAAAPGRFAGTEPLRLGPIVHAENPASEWRHQLLSLGSRPDDVVVIDDFDDGLDDVEAMSRKLGLLDELVSDPSRTVIVRSGVSVRALTDSLRGSSALALANGNGRAGRDGPDQHSTPSEPVEASLDRWKRVINAFVVVDQYAAPNGITPAGAGPSPAAGPPTIDIRPAAKPAADERAGRGQFLLQQLDGYRDYAVAAFLSSEGAGHPFVKRACEHLLRGHGVGIGCLSRRQAFDELLERTTQFYRGLWASCTEDEKVVLGHIARHGLANASARGTVRRLLGRGLLRKDPALRPMNETFRCFVLTRECSKQVAALEIDSGPSAWDRLRLPLGLGFTGLAVFLFATQKDLYNEVVAVTTVVATSLPTLIKSVSTLVGRPAEGPGQRA